MNLSYRLAVPMLLLAAMSCGGCKTGPDYKTPEEAVPDKWSSLSPGVEADKPAVEVAAWWTTLNDPTLTSLITRGVKKNLDLKLAGSRLREARAARGIAAAALLPSLGASASYKRMESPEPKTPSGGSPLTVSGTLTSAGVTPGVSLRGRNVSVMQNGIGSTGSTTVSFTPGGAQSAPSRQSDLFQTGLDQLPPQFKFIFFFIVFHHLPCMGDAYMVYQGL